MKKLLIIVALLLVLLGGVGGTTMLGYGPLAKMLEKATEKVEVAAAPAPSPDFYYDIGSYLIPMVNKGGITRQVGLDLALQVDPKSGPRVSADIPRLQNAITFDLYDFLPHHADPRSPEDKKAVHDRLLKLAVRMYGEGSVRDVIIRSMYER